VAWAIHFRLAHRGRRPALALRMQVLRGGAQEIPCRPVLLMAVLAMEPVAQLKTLPLRRAIKKAVAQLEKAKRLAREDAECDLESVARQLVVLLEQLDPDPKSTRS
jgi:hypothetical protein